MTREHAERKEWEKNLESLVTKSVCFPYKIVKDEIPLGWMPQNLGKCKQVLHLHPFAMLCIFAMYCLYGLKYSAGEDSIGRINCISAHGMRHEVRKKWCASVERLCQTSVQISGWTSAAWSRPDETWLTDLPVCLIFKKSEDIELLNFQNEAAWFTELITGRYIVYIWQNCWERPMRVC